MTADEIREFRKGLGLSQEQFAREVNVSLSTIQKWEIGSRAPNKYTLPYLEKAVRRLGKKGDRKPDGVE